MNKVYIIVLDEEQYQALKDNKLDPELLDAHTREISFEISVEVAVRTDHLDEPFEIIPDEDGGYE